MRVSRVWYQPKLGGQNHGMMHIRIVLGGTEDIPLSEGINRIREQCMNLKVLTIVLDLKELDDDMDPREVSSVISFINVMRDSGFVIACEVFGRQYNPIIKQANYKTVIIEGPSWLGFQTDEIIYKPEMDIMAEPLILPINKNAFKCLLVNRKTFPIAEFLANASNVWSVCMTPRMLFQVNLLE